MNPIYENILTRRSCRAFDSRPISAEDLQMILSAAVYAPSAMNRQTRRFTVLRTREAISALAKVTAAALNRPEYEFFRPSVMIIVSNDTETPNNAFDCACSLQNIFLMAHGLGIGSCWINQMKDAENVPAVREMLTGFGIPPAHHVFGIAVLGYPAKPLPMDADKSPQVIHYADEPR